MNAARALTNLTRLSRSSCPRHIPLRNYVHPCVVPRLPARAMASSSAPQKCEWLVIVPDHEGVLQKRMEVRPNHMGGLKPLIDDGFLLMGGALLHEPPKEGSFPARGSALLVSAASREEVLERIQKDVYVESGVWDLSKVEIYPFKSAVRVGL